jgi:gamma-D-glutamyl-L-lysine dipeptidyl-peptidase
MNDRVLRSLEDIRRRAVPDRRLGVFDVTITEEAGGRKLSGVTTSREALMALRRLAVDSELPEDVRALPDARVANEPAAVATAAVAPLLSSPAIRAERSSEVLHGETLVVLERRDAWLRVRAHDGYHGWMHEGYVRTGSLDWRDDWERRATGRSLGVELKVPGSGRVRLPLGARVALRRSGIELADGQLGDIAGGIVRPDSEAGAEARLLAPPEWATRWFGSAPYLWGGRTDWGVDCSGLAQAVYAVRGVDLPRDTDLQLGAGEEVPITPDGRGYEAGDLLFFAEQGRVSHVALWAGVGHIVHSALSRGGMSSDDLYGDTSLARKLRDGLVGVRRM